MENNTIRYILADEVGLGKTIEAGMVIKELKTRGLVKRILVVCPTGLVTQWAAEMQEKFHEKFNIILPSDYDTIRRLTDNNDVYGQYDQVIVRMCKERDGIAGGALGMRVTTVTTHVFYVNKADTSKITGAFTTIGVAAAKQYTDADTELNQPYNRVGVQKADAMGEVHD